MTGVFLKLVNMSITASWLVLAVILLRFILKRAPKWIDCLLWGIVALRLVMPFSFESVLSLIPTTEPVPPGIIAPVIPSVKPDVPLVDAVPAPVPTPTVSAPEAAADPLQLLLSAASVIWIIGIAAMLVYGGVSYLRVSHSVRASVPIGDDVYFCDSIGSPFLLGVFRTRIYLPSGIDGSQAHYVISHEKAHIARRDHLWKPIGFLLLTVYWFNPVMWAAYILLCRDIEKACDEKVIGGMDADEKKGYMEALVSCSVRRRMIMVCPLAFGEMGIKERVKNVINYKKPTVLIMAVALIASVALAVCFLTDPIAGSDSPDVTEGNNTDGIVTDIGGNEDDSVADEGNDDTINDINDLIEILNAEREEYLSAIGGEPDYLDVEFVKTLTIENYESSEEAYCNYEKTLSESLISALECRPGVAVYRDVDSIYHDPLYTMDYILLDSEKVPYDDEQILTWYLDYRFSGGTYGKEGDLLWYNTYGYEDNENLDFGDMIVIVDKRYTEIYYYDSGTGKSERLDLTTNDADDELIECYSDLRREEGGKEAEEWLLDYYKDDPVELQKLQNELEIWNQ